MVIVEASLVEQNGHVVGVKATKLGEKESKHNQLSMLCHHCSGGSGHRRYIFKYCDGHGNFCKASKRAW